MISPSGPSEMVLGQERGKARALRQGGQDQNVCKKKGDVPFPSAPPVTDSIGTKKDPPKGRPLVSTVTRLLTSWSPALLWAGLIFYLSAQSWADGPVQVQINDKLAHFLLFAVFGITLAWAGRHLTRTKLQIGLILFGVLYAALDEAHQAFVPLRDASAWDFGADLAGLLLGYLVALTLFRRRTGRTAH